MPENSQPLVIGVHSVQGPYKAIPQNYAGARVVDRDGTLVCVVENGGTATFNPTADRIARLLTMDEAA